MGLVNDLVVRLGWDGTAYRKGIKETEQIAEQTAAKHNGIMDKFIHKQEKWLLKHTIMGFGLAKVFGTAEKAVEKLSEIAAGSEKFAVTPEKFQALEYAAQKTGIPIEELAKDVKSLPLYAAEAVRQFERMGKAIPNDQIKDVAAFKRELGASGSLISQLAMTGPAGMMGEKGNLMRGLLGSGMTGIATATNTAAEGLRWLGSWLGVGSFDPENEEMQRDLEAKLDFKRRQKAADRNKPIETHYSGPFGTMLDYELMKERDARDAKFQKILDAKTAFNFDAPNSMNKIGGFGFGMDPGINNILERQVNLLERIERALKDEVPGA